MRTEITNTARAFAESIGYAFATATVVSGEALLGADRYPLLFMEQPDGVHSIVTGKWTYATTIYLVHSNVQVEDKSAIIDDMEQRCVALQAAYGNVAARVFQTKVLTDLTNAGEVVVKMTIELYGQDECRG